MTKAKQMLRDSGEQRAKQRVFLRDAAEMQEMGFDHTPRELSDYSDAALQYAHH